MDKWINIREFINSTLKKVENEIENGVCNMINHYVTHDEYEIAFEIMFSEIMLLKVLPQIDFQRSKQIAVLLNLNCDATLDMDFCDKFNNFLIQNLKNSTFDKSKNDS